MRGQTAKKLRRLAGFIPSEVRSTHGVVNTVRTTPVKDLAGNVIYQCRTITQELDACPRVMYNMLKKTFKRPGVSLAV